jgi:hypothetical protein
MEDIRVSVFMLFVRIRLSINENTPPGLCGLSANFRRGVGIPPIRRQRRGAIMEYARAASGATRVPCDWLNYYIVM